MITAKMPAGTAEQTPNIPHLDQHLEELDVPDFEEEIELWTTYGGE